MRLRYLLFTFVAVALIAAAPGCDSTGNDPGYYREVVIVEETVVAP